MPLEDNISQLRPEHHDLLMLLRAATNETPPSSAPENWPAVLEVARFHQVDLFLYPAVASWPGDCQPDAELMDSWRSAFFSAVMNYEHASAQLKEILEALHQFDVPVIPLKGAWLAENVYDDGACRPMCDFDLLVPLERFNEARSIFKKLGYTTPDHYFDPTRDKDIHYFHPDHPMMIELHFRIWHEVKTNISEPDPERLWIAPIQDSLHGQPIFAFPPERQLIYVAQHILYSSLTIPLRAYLDLALLARKYTYNTELLHTEAIALGVPYGAKFVIRLALELSGVNASEGLADFIADTNIHRERLLSAFRATLELTGASASLRPELVDSRTASLTAKIRISLGVVFKPTGFIRSAYPKSVARFGLIGGYWARLQDVSRRSSTARRKDRDDDPSLETDLQNFNTRRALCEWLLSCDRASGHKKARSKTGPTNNY